MQGCMPPVLSLMAKRVSASLPVWVPLIQPSQRCGHRAVGEVREDPGFTRPHSSYSHCTLKLFLGGREMREGLLRGAEGTPGMLQGSGTPLLLIETFLLCFSVCVCVRGSGSAVIALSLPFPTQESEIQFPENIREQSGCRRREMPEAFGVLPAARAAQLKRARP